MTSRGIDLLKVKNINTILNYQINLGMRFILQFRKALCCSRQAQLKESMRDRTTSFPRLFPLKIGGAPPPIVKEKSPGNKVGDRSVSMKKTDISGGFCI